MKFSDNTLPKILSAHKIYKAPRGYMVKIFYETIHLRRLCTDFTSRILEQM